MDVSGPGELILAPALDADFTSGTLPPGWYVEELVPGGRAEAGEGCLVLQGARVGWERLSGAGRSVEFEAAFGSQPHQHIGFGTDFENVPWVSASTKYGHAVYARTNFYQPEDIRMSPKLRGDFHRYRIEWNILDVRVFVDDRESAYLMVPIPAYMRPLLGNERVGEEPLRVRWLRMSPYRRAGSFTSAVVDGGLAGTWTACRVAGAVPDGTSLAVEVRSGEGAVPDDGWTPWTAAPYRPGTGDRVAIDLAGRYAQYRLALATTRDMRTPRVYSADLEHQPA